DEKMAGTEYGNDTPAGMISVKPRDGTITLKTPTGSFTSSRITSQDKELIELFYATCKIVNQRKLEIFKLEEMKREETEEAARIASEKRFKEEELYRQKEKQAISDELERINNACINAGYEGY